ncbi:histidine phosphatase family protein [Aureimonas fodinaquatilis]|uniref:Histidine phosphatase family protein n=1 Tax=Aureimonas fodinaquatilis TaxID=2565783 RepID=A0A5B0E0X4_9HYPH|nr:histidine phosphatase family protein [Aureimonas fodinaquatilis]KAA0972473.1 histidine phosphatase family protein [Aureimonas fodinaquatilis]
MTAILPLIYLCRHGQTDWNAVGRIQGQIDTPLNNLGRAQAKRNGRYLRNVLGEGIAGFDFLASPLARTRETMRIIRRECSLPEEDFATDPRLMELNFGDWQGYTLAQIAEHDMPAIRERKAHKWDFVPPGTEGESYQMLAERAQPVFEALQRPTIVVAHGGISRIFLKLYAATPGAKAAHSAVFQDRILKFENGQVSWV